MQGEEFLVKSHFAQFPVNSQCFIPRAKFLKGVRLQHLGRKCLRAGSSPALHCVGMSLVIGRNVCWGWLGKETGTLCCYPVFCSLGPFVRITC